MLAALNASKLAWKAAESPSDKLAEMPHRNRVPSEVQGGGGIACVAESAIFAASRFIQNQQNF